MAAHLLPAAAAVGELAERSGIREALQWFTREKQWVNEFHLKLCRIPAPTFLEQQRAEWISQQFRSFGWHTGVDRAGNVLASLEAHPPGPLVAVSAHLDTVLAPRTKDDISVDPGGNFRGPGVSDNGAGLAALLALARTLQLHPDAAEQFRRLVIVANVGEEGEGNLNGMRYLCREFASAGESARGIKTFLILDGAATDHITVQALGSRRFEVTFSGPGGHSWSDFGIGNPIHALSRALSTFVDSKVQDQRSYGREPSSRVSLNVGVIEGGSGVNAIASSARAKIDIRSESNDRIEELVSALQHAVMKAEEFENKRAVGGKVSARIRDIGNRPAARLSQDAFVLGALRAVDAHLGIRSRLDCASTDANIPLSLGIPAVSIGAGGSGGGAHTTGEWFCRAAGTWA